MGEEKKGKQVSKGNKAKERKRRNEVSRKRTADNRKCNHMIDRVRIFLEIFVSIQSLILYWVFTMGMVSARNKKHSNLDTFLVCW